jgi:Phosphoesterase family
MKGIFFTTAIAVIFLVLFSGGMSVAATQSSTIKSTPSGVDQFVIIIFENYPNLMMPLSNFQSLKSAGVYDSNFWSIGHTSEPNYLALVSGSAFGITSDIVPPDKVWTKTGSADTLGQLLEAKGFTWKEYDEAYPGSSACSGTTGPIGLWSSKHSPFINFKSVAQTSECSNIQSYENFTAATKGGDLPSFSVVVPDLCDDGHGTPSCTKQTAANDANTFLGTFVSLVKSGPQWKAGTLVICLIFDENTGEDGSAAGTADSTYGGNVPIIMDGAKTKHDVTLTQQFNYYSLLATIEKIYGTGNLGRFDATQPYGTMNVMFSVSL